MQQQREPLASESYYFGLGLAIGLHVLVFGMLVRQFCLYSGVAAGQADCPGDPVPAEIEKSGNHPDQSEDCGVR